MKTTGKIIAGAALVAVFYIATRKKKTTDDAADVAAKKQGLVKLRDLQDTSNLLSPKQQQQQLNALGAGKLLCNRTNLDGSHTWYTSQGGDTPCPYGGKVQQAPARFLGV
jgi:hypothetical protein